MKLQKTFIFTLALLLAIAAIAPMLFAQTLTSGDITGTITDPSGAVIPNVKVTLKSNDQGFTKTTTTNSNGFYRFSLLPPGSYNISVAAPGFQNFTANTAVSVGTATSMNAKLALATAGTTVEVTAAPGVVQTENGNIATTFNQQQIALVPNPGNDLSYIAQTSPGATMNTQQGYGNFSDFGLPGTSNLFTYNGMNENDPFFNLNNSGATNLLLGNNDVGQVTVVSNGYEGQYGGLAGANVNYTSKSGSNAFHGNAKYYWNGRYVNANTYFNNQAGVPRPFVNANQWAGSIGGPIIKDKTFFFVDQEGLYLTIPVTRNVRIPSPQFQAATLANLAGRSSASIPFYQRMFSLWNNAPGASGAADVLSGGGCGSFSAAGLGATGAPCALQFQSSVSNKTHEWLLTARVDQNISSNDKLFLRFRTDHGVQASYTDPLDPVFNGVSTQPQYEGQLQETHTFGSGSVNQFILAGSWYSAIFSTPNLAASQQLFPFQLTFAGGAFRPLGANLNIWPQGRNVTQYQIIDDYSLTRGKHTLKFGVNFRRNDITDYNPGIGSIGNVQSESLSDFFNGTTTSYIQSFPSRATQPVALYSLGLYVQDEFRVTSNLSLTLALRADHNSNPVCQTDCFARLNGDFLAIDHSEAIPYNQVISTGLHQALRDYTNINWQPRFGFAWSPFGRSSQTVIRGGFGLFSDAFPGTVADLFLNNPPLTNQFTVSGVPVSTDLTGNAQAEAAAANQAFVTGFNSGATLSTLTALGFPPPTITTPTHRIHDPRYQKWNLEFQQGIGSKTSLSFNYVGNHGIHEAIQNANINAFCDAACLLTLGAPAGVTSFNGLPAAPTDPRFGAVNQIQTDGVSNYNGVTVSLQRRMSQVTWQVNYTWSHALDTVSNAGFLQYNFNTNTSVLAPQNPFNVRQFMYGNADYDVRHNLSLNYVWNTPFKFSNGLVNTLLGGWVFGGTLFARTGLPFTIIDSSATGTLAGNNFGGPLNGTGSFVFANWSGTGATSCAASGAVIGIPCFVGPNSSSPDPAITLATSGLGVQRRNQFRGPHFFDTDLNVTKNFKIPHWESGRLAFGAQFFNLLNHPNFDQPIGDAADPGFGTIILPVNPPTSIYGSFLGADASPRTIQGQIQLTF